MKGQLPKGAPAIPNITGTYTKVCAPDYKANIAEIVKAGGVYDESSATYTFSSVVMGGQTTPVPGGSASIKVFCDGHAATLAASTAAIAAITLSLY